MPVLVSGRLLGGGFAALELVGELLDAAGGINQALLAGVGGMGVHGDIAQHDEVFDPVDLLLTGGLHGGLGEEALARRDVEKTNVIENGMAFGFHGENIGLVA